MPDYEIKEWNESNFDVNIIPYTQEAYEKKKFAFVSDYARFWILHQHGGVYLDTDVELLKSIDSLVQNKSFMAREQSVNDFNDFSMVNPGLGMASIPKLPLYSEILADYENRSFLKKGKPDYTTVVTIVTNILKKHGLPKVDCITECCGQTIYPTKYFCPQKGPSGQIKISDETYSIHHFAGSWIDSSQKSFVEKLWNFFRLPKTNFRKKLFHK